MPNCLSLSYGGIIAWVNDCIHCKNEHDIREICKSNNSPEHGLWSYSESGNEIVAKLIKKRKERNTNINSIVINKIIKYIEYEVSQNISPKAQLSSYIKMYVESTL